MGIVVKSIFVAINKVSLVQQILIGLIVGIALAMMLPEMSKSLTIFGKIFVAALKGVAPILVLFLVMSAISQHKVGKQTNMKMIVMLYIVGMILAGLIAVIMNFIFPISLSLKGAGADTSAATGSIVELMKNMLLNLVDNPVNALTNANYLGILTWAIIMGILLKTASETTKTLVQDFSDVISEIVVWIIKCAPIGIMGLVIDAIATNGIESLLEYGQLIVLLVSCFIIVALVLNPLIVFFMIRRNPYPLVFKCLKQSGLTAFFTRSSAANIPVNMKLCEEMGLDKDTYAVSIPLGATVNMMGSTVTIATLTLAAAFTIQIDVSIPMAVVLIIVSAISACGVSGVPGGALLLIPLSCSMFGIPEDIVMQVVGIGFIISIVQDSIETGINSSTDVLYTAAADINKHMKLKKNNQENIAV